MHGEEAVASERGRSLREESGRRDGRTGHGCRSGPLAGCRGVCNVVVSFRWSTDLFELCA